MILNRFIRLSLFLLFLTGSSFPTAQGENRTVKFNRDIRPILSNNCFACHGPDAKTVEGDLRLDLRESATGPGMAIVPGHPEKSILMERVLSEDSDMIMPPVESHKELSREQIQLLRQWIAEGAEYESHWAYTDLVRPGVPEGEGTEIDRFINAHLRNNNIHPVPQADRITLIRRLSLDLTGMPPTPEEVDEFLNDKSDQAYEKLVDRLLASPRFGERLAIYWLDLVRYADTVGYHGDQDVSQSPYRDYVINAFNSNMPYNQFVKEQLAGDLLPEATIDQLVASGYNRLNQTTEEGGAQPKEYLAIYFADLVRNVSQVFMGATMGCCQCHDHKYDPYTMKDFYSLGAFFADLEEVGKYNARTRPPEISVPSEELKQQIAHVEEKIKSSQNQLAEKKKSLIPYPAEWEQTIREEISNREPVENVWVDDNQDVGGTISGAWNFADRKKYPVKSGQKSRRQYSDGLVQHYFMGTKKTVTVTEETRFYSWIYLDPKNPPKSIMIQLNDGSWDHRKYWGTNDIVFGRKDEDWAGYHKGGDLPETGEWFRLEVEPAEIGLAVGSVINGMAFTQFGGIAYWDKSGWISEQKVPEKVDEALAIAPDQRTKEQADVLENYYLDSSESIIEIKNQISEFEKQKINLENSAPKTVISKSVEPRTIRVLARGNWMDESGEIVSSAIPEFMGKLETGDKRASRLDLAEWLCQSDNPLTSRTMVNRLWYLMFGRGICSSVDDLGGQGTYPSHPDLLDWLSVEFVESGWDIKHVLREIVNSEAYKRSSKPTPELRKTDPYNELLARQKRFILPAEMIRDSVLATSGLLVEKVGGISTKPYQPAGYYAQLNFPRREYQADQNENQYRRGVYTHWQRTFLHPMLKAFDAPSREECTAARSRSNTPLQALTLLNDPTFVEAARVFAERILREGGASPEEKIQWAYRETVSRNPEKEIADEIKVIFEKHLEFYKQHQEEAKELIGTGLAPVATDLDASELAAWTSVARVLFNLNETITRY